MTNRHRNRRANRRPAWISPPSIVYAICTIVTAIFSMYAFGNVDDWNLIETKLTIENRPWDDDDLDLESSRLPSKDLDSSREECITSQCTISCACILHTSNPLMKAGRCARVLNQRMDTQPDKKLRLLTLCPYIYVLTHAMTYEVSALAWYMRASLCI